MDEKQGAPVGYNAPPGYTVPPQQNYPQGDHQYNPQQQYPPPGATAPYGGQATAVAYSGQGQPNVVVVQTPVQQRPESYMMHILLSCFVCYCCGLIFGLIAFILALVAKSRADNGQTEEARSMGKASLGISIAGLVIGILMIVILVILYFTGVAILFNNIKKICPDGYNC